ncbi:MAG: PaaI family thioesterase [Oscillospiraceae bacterium]|nr:PaaI family thioesterase [Oscillospiraceae bacterium]
MNEKQLHMEESIRAFLDKINREQGDSIIGMLQPRFVECSAEEASLTMAYPAMAWERNPLNVMQGGVVATILDFSIACLAVYYGGDKAVTVSLPTSYLRGCPIDGTLVVKVKATKAGRTMIHAYSECWEEKTPDKLVATSVGVYYA